jgi:hypothetical protein
MMSVAVPVLAEGRTKLLEVAVTSGKWGGTGPEKTLQAEEYVLADLSWRVVVAGRNETASRSAL